MRVALLRTSRVSALGEHLRAGTWRTLFGRLGADVVDVELLDRHRIGVAPRRWPPIGAVVRGRAVPESLAWSPSSLPSADLTIALTARAFAPELLERRLVLDFIDQLSENYRQRTGAASTVRAAAFRGLAPAHRRFESWAAANVPQRVAAGWRDSERLGAEWVPILAPPFADGRATPDVDVLFFGNLTYEPNVAALEHLGRLWPRLRRDRPGITGRVAGRYPSDPVRRLVATHGWQLEEDFPDVVELCASARVGVVPLTIATGIQTKALEAGAYGLAQVLSDVAAGGFGPYVPGEVAATDDQFVETVSALLDDDAARRASAERARQVLTDHYSADAWLPTAARFLDG